MKKINKKKPTKEFHTPGKIESTFRKNLGLVNPYMCLVDSAVKEIIDLSKKSSPEEKYLKNITKKAGHPKIYTESINFEHLQQLVHLSHISLIQAKAEEACANIRKLNYINSLHVNDIDGDFLRKTIYTVHKSKEGKNPKNGRKPKKLGKEIYIKYIDEIEILLIDYYRLSRNINLHGSQNIIDKNKHFINNLEVIKSTFGYEPNNYNSFDENDVYLFSLAWQSCIKKICSLSVNIERDLIPKLKKRYKGYTKIDRIKSGIIQTLKQEYLIKDSEKLDNISESVSTSIIG